MLPLVCCFDGGDVAVQGLPFDPSTPKCSSTVSQEISGGILPVNLQTQDGSVVTLSSLRLKTN